MVMNMSSTDSLVCQYVAELRNVDVQQDRMRFRRNLERIAEIAAYEISKQLQWTETDIQTPLSPAKARMLKDQPIVASILRAGVPMHNGLLHYFDQADNAFISAYRKHNDEGDFIIELEYLSSPDISGRVLIVCDPMLATGSSMAQTLKELFKLGQPLQTHIVCAIASRKGIDCIRQQIPKALIWAGDIDEILDHRSYIVPGLGDAGDLAFGSKLQF